MSAEHRPAGRPPRVLMASANYWRSPFQVGSHHLARGFAAAGWEVAFVSDPISPLHFLHRHGSDLEARAAVWRAGGVRELGGRLWSYVPAAAATPNNRPLLRSAWLQRRWHRLTLPPVARTARAAGFEAVDLLYLDSVTQAFWLDVLPHRRSVLRVADRTTGFVKCTPALARLEREVARRVDLVAYTAENLREYVGAMGPRRMLHLPNGVNFAHFADGARALPPELDGIPRPIVVYVGAMEAWFDFALVQHAAEALPGMSFVLIGPDHLARRRLAPRPNLHLLGRRPYDALPGYLHNADVGIIPFDVAGHPALVHGVNPLKLLEYLACGLRVVATSWDELRALRSPARLADTPDDFVAALRGGRPDAAERAAAVAYAGSADWAGRVRTLLEKLDLAS